jgi:hypothetical protein
MKKTQIHVTGPLKSIHGKFSAESNTRWVGVFIILVSFLVGGVCFTTDGEFRSELIPAYVVFVSAFLFGLYLFRFGNLAVFNADSITLTTKRLWGHSTKTIGVSVMQSISMGQYVVRRKRSSTTYYTAVVEIGEISISVDHLKSLDASASAEKLAKLYQKDIVDKNGAMPVTRKFTDLDKAYKSEIKEIPSKPAKIQKLNERGLNIIRYYVRVPKGGVIFITIVAIAVFQFGLESFKTGDFHPVTLAIVLTIILILALGLLLPRKEELVISNEKLQIMKYFLYYKWRDIVLVKSSIEYVRIESDEKGLALLSDDKQYNLGASLEEDSLRYIEYEIFKV